ncbi:MAG: ATP-binding protein [Promethearchaeota archaeon]
MKKPIGTIIAARDSPTPSEFKLVITEIENSVPLRKGQFIAVESADVEGILIATVTNIMKTNRYFESAEAVKEYERSGPLGLTSIFPADRWEYILAEGKPMGRISLSGRLERVSFPPAPGDKVFLATSEILQQVLGLDASGINLGKLLHHDVPVTLNLTKLLQKHVAILAISGAGKSYLTSVLIEELLMRKPEQGRVAVVILDVHGEYTSLATASDSTKYNFSEKTTIINGPYVQLGVPKLTSYSFAGFQPQMSYVQIRELNQIIKKLRSTSSKTGKPYDLNELIGMVEQSEMNPRTKEAMLGWIYDLESTHLFGFEEHPSLRENIKVGHATIFDLREIISLRKKQIIVSYLLSRLFNMRKSDEVPPFVCILEEAHQFCPEKTPAISKSIIETIAREGRKFYSSLVLISQRPVRLSTTILSQMGTHIYLRITNPYDLKLIGQSSEMIDKSSLDAITTLNIGDALIVGNAVSHPIFARIRTRYSPSPSISMPLEEVAKKYEKKSA